MSNYVGYLFRQLINWGANVDFNYVKSKKKITFSTCFVKKRGCFV